MEETGILWETTSKKEGDGGCTKRREKEMAVAEGLAERGRE